MQISSSQDEELPNEIIASILHFIAEPTHQFLQFSFVCKQWNQTIKQYFLNDIENNQEAKLVIPYQCCSSEQNLMNTLKNFRFKQLIYENETLYSFVFDSLKYVNEVTFVTTEFESIDKVVNTLLNNGIVSAEPKRINFIGCKLLMNNFDQSIRDKNIKVSIAWSYCAFAVRQVTILDSSFNLSTVNAVSEIIEDTEIVRSMLPIFHPFSTRLIYNINELSRSNVAQIVMRKCSYQIFKEILHRWSSVIPAFASMNWNIIAYFNCVVISRDFVEAKQCMKVLFDYCKPYLDVFEFLEDIEHLSGNSKQDIYSALLHHYYLSEEKQLVNSFIDSTSGDTLLHLAATLPKLDLLQYLLSRPKDNDNSYIINLESLNNNNETPLFKAAMVHRFTHFTHLLNAGSNLFCIDSSNKNFFEYIIDNRTFSMDIINKLIVQRLNDKRSASEITKLINFISPDWWKQYIDINRMNDSNYNHISHYIKLINVLNLKWKGPRDGWISYDKNHDSLLHIACSMGNTELVTAILDSTLFFPDQTLGVFHLFHECNLDGNSPFHLLFIQSSNDDNRDRLKAGLLNVIMMSYVPDNKQRTEILKAQNRKNQTPLQLATISKLSSVVNIIQKYMPTTNNNASTKRKASNQKSSQTQKKKKLN
jgi:ankyrin repeat protein